MDTYEKDNWLKIKDYFETLPEHKRDNWFYKRAVQISSGKEDPMKDTLWKPDDKKS